MLLGFISLLLTIFQGFIRDLCIPEHLTSDMLPCPKEATGSEGREHREYAFHPSWGNRRLLSEAGNGEHCAKKGMAQFMSLEALHQLHIFIFVLAVAYVVFLAITMVLGRFKVRKWKHWEYSIQREISNSNQGDKLGRVTQNHARHHLAFFSEHKGYSAVSSLLTHGSTNPRFDFHKYMLRTLEYDFKKVVGISWYLWTFVVLFLLLNLKGWHSYFYLSFLPFILLLIVGAKLEYIITSLAEEIQKKENNAGPSKPDGENRLDPWAKPSDKHFWFGRPGIVLYLIHFILFQNSFEIAFFFWVLVTYGIHSCILEKIGFIIPRLIVGVFVQVLCSYSTLPLYTIVTQMGSRFKQGFFNRLIHESVDTWFGDARDRTHRGDRVDSNRIEMHSMIPESCEIVPAVQETTVCLEGCTIPQPGGQSYST